MATIRFSELSQSRQHLIRICQTTNFGSIEDLVVEGGEPMLTASTSNVLEEVKLGAEQGARPEALLYDFVLCREFSQLMALLDRIENAQLSKIEIRAGLPRRILIARSVAAHLALLSSEPTSFEEPVAR